MYEEAQTSELDKMDRNLEKLVDGIARKNALVTPGELQEKSPTG